MKKYTGYINYPVNGKHTSLVRYSDVGAGLGRLGIAFRPQLPSGKLSHTHDNSRELPTK